VSASPEGIRIKGRDLQSLLKRGAANFIKRPIEPEAPLRVMEGFSQILEDDDSESPQQLQNYLKTIQEEARRTAALIEDLIASNEQNGQPLSRSQRR
jgi:signal transduction histidine kinase